MWWSRCRGSLLHNQGTRYAKYNYITGVPCYGVQKHRQFGDAIWSCMHTWELCPSSARMLSRFDKRLLYLGVQVALAIAAIVVAQFWLSFLYGTKMRILGLCPAFRTYTTSCWHFSAENWIWCDVCAIFVTSPDWAREVQRGLDLTFTLQWLSVVADIFFLRAHRHRVQRVWGCERSMCNILAQPNLVANMF